MSGPVRGAAGGIMNNAQIGFFVVLGLMAVVFHITWFRAARRHQKEGPKPLDFGVAGLTAFLDTLGIGSFAPTTALFKLFRMVPDELIPGTLNVGLAWAAIAESLIFVKSVVVEPTLLASVIGSAVIGSWFGAGVVRRLPRRSIQFAMGTALLIAASIFIGVSLNLLPGGGEAMALGGWRFAVAVGTNFIYGALMTVGIGLFAPCMITLALLGMAPIAAFPIMMGACGLVQMVGGMRLLESGKVAFGTAIGMAIGSLVGVAIAAFIVKSLPLGALRWLVIGVVTYAAMAMLRSALTESRSVATAQPVRVP
ncbi:MAG: sulfite exporter TauE/SafE family protein [Steroidobacteraceae bacterium]